MQLRSLTDEELVSYFRCTRNDFTTTDLEIELAERLAAAIDSAEQVDGLEKQIEQLEEDKEELATTITALKDTIKDIKQLVNTTEKET